jgi:hypothetical protein
VFEAVCAAGLLTVSVHSQAKASRRRASSLPDGRSGPACRR